MSSVRPGSPLCWVIDLTPVSYLDVKSGSKIFLKMIHKTLRLVIFKKTQAALG